VEDVLVETCLRSCTYCCQCHQQNQIAAYAVVLVELLSVVDAAKYAFWHVELCKSNHGLYDDQNKRDQAHNAMYICESSLGMAGFVHLDDDQTSNEGYRPCEIECKMYVSALRLLFRSRCRLEHQNGLRDKQNASRIDELSKCQQDRRRRPWSSRTGWYEKKMTSFMNTLDQTRAASFKTYQREV